MEWTARRLDDELHEFMRFHRQTMKRFFSECGLFNGHPFMLFCIRQQPQITPAELAREMELPPASVTISLKRMEAAGLLTRTPDTADRRRIHLQLTEKGERLDERCRQGRSFLSDNLFDGFSPAEREQFGSMLERMKQNLQQADAAAWLAQNEKLKEESE